MNSQKLTSIVAQFAVWLALTCVSATNVAAQESWEFAAMAYAWLPTIETEAADTTTEIKRSDLIEDLDFTVMFALRATHGKWTLDTDVIYFDISNKVREPVDELIELKKLGLEAWVVTPTVGYQIYQSEKHQIQLYGGGRYLWIEANPELEILLPPGQTQKLSDSAADWNAIVGFRGRYSLSDKWHVNYALDAGKGESDAVYQATSGLAYAFNRFDAIVGWRYLDFDLGSDASPETLKVNGPYAGIAFQF